MEIVNDEKIKVEQDGVTKEYDVLFSFDSEDTMRTYIGYTDHSKNDRGEENIYVSSFDPVIGLDSLSGINDKEKDMVEDVIREIRGEVK
ncbi:MAG: DUF1292 domain-containing protein [Bacilli bacterium]|nr:DUF1292 domain-containing protein [Bacilli bacterium]